MKGDTRRSGRLGRRRDESVEWGNVVLRGSNTAAVFQYSTAAVRQLSDRLLQTICTPWFFSGNVRIRLPVAAKYAFSTAGAATQIVGSPTPPQTTPDCMMIDSTFGICLIRIESYALKFVCSIRPSLTVHSCMNSAESP